MNSREFSLVGLTIISASSFVAVFVAVVAVPLWCRRASVVSGAVVLLQSQPSGTYMCRYTPQYNKHLSVHSHLVCVHKKPDVYIIKKTSKTIVLLYNKILLSALTRFCFKSRNEDIYFLVFQLVVR